MRSARGHFQSAHGGITGPRRDMPAELSDRTIRGERHVSYKQRVRPVPSAVFAMRDAEKSRVTALAQPWYAADIISRIIVRLDQRKRWGAWK